jgi:hypothetical protein
MLKRLTKNDYKEEYRLFFMVKGHLNATPETVVASANGYFKRLWYDGGDGAPLYDYNEQFEEAWSKLNGEQSNSKSE